MSILLRALVSSCLVIAAACGGKAAAPATPTPTPAPAEPAPAPVAEPDRCGGCPDGQVCNPCPGDPTCPECAVCGAPVCVPAP